MKKLATANVFVSTILAFALIPLSGFATDVYLPSFPQMANVFGTDHLGIQMSLAVFVISNGIGQLFVGGFMDSFGRFKLSIYSLAVFAISSVVIALSHNVALLLTLRVIQGIAVAVIVVGKRAFFIDVYSGDQLKQYTSLFSIMWAAAPIIAPFVGGILQFYIGWQSNFYFLAAVTITILTLELIYSGETLKTERTFQPVQLWRSYKEKLAIPDFTLTIFILGSTFASVTVFNMASPFIISNVFHQSTVTIGNCSLLCGLAILIGGLISKKLIRTEVERKSSTAIALMFVVSVSFAIAMHFLPDLYLMMTLVVLYHIIGGFTFNTFYTHALSRFTSNAGVVSGMVGGGTFIVASLVSYMVVQIIDVVNPASLGLAYLSCTFLIGFFLLALHVVEKTKALKSLNPAA